MRYYFSLCCCCDNRTRNTSCNTSRCFVSIPLIHDRFYARSLHRVRPVFAAGSTHCHKRLGRAKPRTEWMASPPPSVPKIYRSRKTSRGPCELQTFPEKRNQTDDGTTTILPLCFSLNPSSLCCRASRCGSRCTFTARFIIARKCSPLCHDRLDPRCR